MRAELQQLAKAVETIECRSFQDDSESSQSRLATGWMEVDEALGGGLAKAAIHEWFGDFHFSRTRWMPPMAVLIHLARRALQRDSKSRTTAVWIGRRCWPHAHALIVRQSGNDALLHRSLFIDPHDDAARLWAIDLALRSSAVGVVIADGSQLLMPHTKRLQLAAEACGNGQAICLLARPAHELVLHSAARTRWRVTSQPSHGVDPGWNLELLRCKGVRPVAAAAKINLRWAVEYAYVQSSIHLPASVVDRFDSKAVAERRSVINCRLSA